MRSQHALNLRPLDAIVLNMAHDGFQSGNYPARTKIPLVLDERCSRIAGDHPAALQSGALPMPCTFHFELPTDAVLAFRIHARSLPVIKAYTRGISQPQLIGYEVVHDDTLFKESTASGNIPMFASSSLSADTYGMPPIDIVLPTGLTDKVLQITFYDRPLDDFIIELWADRNFAVEFGTVPTSADFETQPSAGWVSCKTAGVTQTLIDTVYPLAQCAGSPSDGKLFVVLMTGTTWYGLYTQGMTMSMLSSAKSRTGDVKRLGVGDEQVIEGVPFGLGLPKVTAADATTILTF